MKVIILNAGTGKRLRNLTRSIPKCLIKIKEDETILDLQLNAFKQSNLKDIIMLTGPFSDKIENYVNNNFPSMNVKYVHNPKYENTNYIYSLYLAKDYINEDIILVHGDLIFSNKILEKLMDYKEDNCVLINKEIPIPQKDFKALIIGERIVKIGVNIFGDNSAFLAPLYKLSESFFVEWIKKIEEYINLGKIDCYAEDALNEILDELILKPFYIDDIIVMEIDDFEDLEKIRELLTK